MDSPIITKQSSKSSSTNSIPIRISRSTARHLRSILGKCNRKSYGRKVKADDVLRQALEELTDAHIEEIRQSSYSSQDRLEIEFKKYCKNHGAISKDKFLSMLLKNGLPEVAVAELGKIEHVSQHDHNPV
ncbi:MAG: hypothetical protein AB8G05_04125 [Oligoflexales bacterium]